MGLRKGFSFFGPADKVVDMENQSFNVAASFPSWYFTKSVQGLKEDVTRQESKMKKAMGMFGDERTAMITKANLERNKALLSKILKSRPNPTDQERSFLTEFYAEGEKRIREESFSRDEDMMGDVDPHERLAKNTSPYIPVDKYGDIFLASNIKPTHGKVTLSEFTIAWKIVGRLLSLNTNTKYLMKPDRGGGDRAPSEHSLDFQKYCAKHGV